MFRRLGLLSARYPIRVIVAWLVATVAVVIALPQLSSVVSSSQASYLPGSANSVQGEQLLKRAFPHRYSASSAVAIVTGSRAARDLAVRTYSAFAAHRLRPAPNNVASDTLTPQIAGVLDSADGTATLIGLGWAQPDTSSAPGDAVTSFRAYIARHPYPGITAGITGDVAITSDYQDQIGKSTAISTLATIAIVVGIMLLVFRSLALTLVPLTTIGLSVLISMGVVAFLGTHGLTVSSNTPIFMIVLLAGAGTDYCLFLASRFKEEMASGKDPAAALTETMAHVGGAIASSGLAVIVGTGGMAFASFGLFNTTGPAVAVGVAITALAGVTLAPAVLRLLGRRAFWPAAIGAPRRSRLWGGIGEAVTRRPLIAVGALLLVLLPLNAAVLKTAQDFNFLADLNATVEADSAFTTIEAHYGAGNALPSTLVIASSRSLRSPTALAHLDALAIGLARVPGIGAVQGPTRPAGKPIPYGNYTTSPQIAAVLARNLSADGHTAQLTIVTSLDPYSQAAQDALKAAQDTAQRAFPGAQVHSTGATASSADIREITGSDLLRISIFVLGGIFLVLVVLLRQIVAPLYLLATVLLSLGATIGATTLVFQGLLGHSGLVFWVPFLILTMLIGLSTDYNILLISRVREEAARGGAYREAVATAVERTGGIITTCGLILAGTFGTLVLANVSGLREMGFAVAFGVVLDTLLLRSVLVPALAVLFGPSTRRASTGMPAAATDPIAGVA